MKFNSIINVSLTPYLSKTLKFCCFQFIFNSYNHTHQVYTVVSYQSFCKSNWGNPSAILCVTSRFNLLYQTRLHRQISKSLYLQYWVYYINGYILIICRSTSQVYIYLVFLRVYNFLSYKEKRNSKEIK